MTLSCIFFVCISSLQLCSCFRLKPRKMLVTGPRTATATAQDIQNGIPLMPNLSPVTSSEALRHLPTAAANTNQMCDIISLEDDNDYNLPRWASTVIVCSLSWLVFFGSVILMFVPFLDKMWTGLYHVIQVTILLQHCLSLCVCMSHCVNVSTINMAKPNLLLKFFHHLICA